MDTAILLHNTLLSWNVYFFINFNVKLRTMKVDELKFELLLGAV